MNREGAEAWNIGEEAMKEGGYIIEQFKEKWKEIHGYWNPNEVVWVYEFKILEYICPN